MLCAMLHRCDQPLTSLPASCSYYGDQQEFRQRMEPKGSFSLRGAKAELNDAENKGLPVPKAFMIRCDVRTALTAPLRGVHSLRNLPACLLPSLPLLYLTWWRILSDSLLTARLT